MQRLDPQAHQNLLDLAVAEFAAATRFPLVFGGFESRGVATVTSITGNRTQSLLGLCVHSGRGLGGRAMIERRPRLTMDYRSSRHITHDYDSQVLGEGIRALFAYPVIVGGATRAVLYGGARTSTFGGAEFAQAAASVGAELAREIEVQDEIDRRATRLAARLATEQAPRGLPGPVLETLRSSHAELRSIAATVHDEALRSRLARLERSLATIEAASPQSSAAQLRIETAQPDTAEAPEGGDAPQLTARELDVVSHAALGGTNSEIGQALGLAESTVKSYLKTAMSKLEASTRHAAVATARRHGLIP